MIKYPHNAIYTTIPIDPIVIYKVCLMNGDEKKVIFETSNYLQGLAYITDMRRKYGRTLKFKML